METQIEIFKFTDYRAFLRTHNEEKKKLNPAWSLGIWSRSLGISSKSALAMVLRGERHPGKSMIQKFDQYFKFNKKEKDYFSNLIKLKQHESDPTLSVLIMEKMGRIHPDGRFILLDDKSFATIANWHYYAIREMVHLKDFNRDPDWIVRKLRFKVTALQAKKAIDDLIKLNLLRETEEGKLISSVGQISTPDEVASEAIKRFHEQSIDNAKESVRTIDVKKRYLSGITLTIKEENLEKMKIYIRQFEDKLIEMFEENPGESTVQLNIQLFPLTKDSQE